MAEELFDVEPAAPPASDKEGEAGGGAAIVIRLHVQPAAGRSVIAGRYGDALHVRVAPPPANGRANSACAELLAELFGVKESAIELVSGEKSRAKRFRIRGLDGEDAHRLLNEALEQASNATGPTRRGGRPGR